MHDTALTSVAHGTWASGKTSRELCEALRSLAPVGSRWFRQSLGGAQSHPVSVRLELIEVAAPQDLRGRVIMPCCLELEAVLPSARAFGILDQDLKAAPLPARSWSMLEHAAVAWTDKAWIVTTMPIMILLDMEEAMLWVLHMLKVQVS